jgi:hypothetical protein
MKLPTLASSGALALITLFILSACTESADSTTLVPITTVIVAQPAAQPPSPAKSSPAKSTTPALPGQTDTTSGKTPVVPVTPVVSEQPAVPVKNKEPATRAPSTSTPSVSTPETPTAPDAPVQATEASLNHYCLLSDHSNLCSRTSMYADWPGHSLKLEPINNTNHTLTGTLVIEYDPSKIEPGTDGNLRSSVNKGNIAFLKAPGTLTIKNFNIYPGRNYHYIWSRLKKNVDGTVFGKATFSWRQNNQVKYMIGCYEFKTGSQSGGNDNIQGIEKNRFNAYGGMDCGKPNIPN